MSLRERFDRLRARARDVASVGRLALSVLAALLRDEDPLGDRDDPFDDPEVNAYFRQLGELWTVEDCRRDGVQWCFGCPDVECYDNPNREPRGFEKNPTSPSPPTSGPAGSPFPDDRARLWPALGTYWSRRDDPTLVVRVVSYGFGSVYAAPCDERDPSKARRYSADDWPSQWVLAAPWEVKV